MSDIPALKRPHFITDNDGRIVSCYAFDSVNTLPFMNLVNGRKEKIGLIRCNPQDADAFGALFFSDGPDFQVLREDWVQKSLEILNKDLEGVLYTMAHETSKFSDTLHRCCLYLRAYCMAENCSIFGLADGMTLSGLMAIYPAGNKDESGTWNYSSMNIAGIVLKTKQPYICQNPGNDPNFAKTDAHTTTRNLICYPILNRGEVVGIVNISQKLSGSFQDTDLLALQKFSTVISHILREEFERRRSEAFLNTSANLSQYLSSSVVRKIATTGTSGELGGEKRKVVALFSDIRSFTTITEGIDPALLVKLLNFYFEEMSAIIAAHEGTLDKLVGDLIMVLWNIPNEQPEAELMAIRCALEMQKVAKLKVAPEWANHGVRGFGCGIGINVGDAVVGNLGSSRFRNYTAIGNTINTAQRLESKAKAGEIWVHENMIPAIKGKVPQPVRVESNLQLKGLTKPVSAFVFKSAF